MKTIVATLAFTKSTKNTHRYDAPEGTESPVGNLYLDKAAVEGEAPKSITLTISA